MRSVFTRICVYGVYTSRKHGTEDYASEDSRDEKAKVNP